MLSLQDIDNIVLNGGIVVDADGEKIGSVEQIFTSGDSGEPVFVTVRTGLFGMSESFAPLSGASLEESVIRVAFAKDTVKNGPRIDSNRGVITATQERELYRYYGLAADASGEGSGTGTAPDDSAAAGETVPRQTTADAAGNEGRIEADRARSTREMPLRPLPHAGPPPPPPHLQEYVPPPPPPHPGPHPPHRPPGPPPEPGPIP
ncbi:PRC-barrel domain-containing protein [Arthrobacter sp. PAMC25564]|uniref:PRC-barrel domain-containing protein n=1 Tax=Arthrobacter sp. PAMC25564 TaxID=2565366 RepID=UPI0014462FAB|nr:PRC-barrel domain-containing protein [Arthrobacter sp. PAMC25564]